MRPDYSEEKWPQKESVAYTVTFANLTAEMMDKLLSWTLNEWGNIADTTIEAGKEAQ